VPRGCSEERVVVTQIGAALTLEVGICKVARVGRRGCLRLQLTVVVERGVMSTQWRTCIVSWDEPWGSGVGTGKRERLAEMGAGR